MLDKKWIFNVTAVKHSMKVKNIKSSHSRTPSSSFKIHVLGLEGLGYYMRKLALPDETIKEWWASELSLSCSQADMEGPMVTRGLFPLWQMATCTCCHGMSVSMATKPLESRHNGWLLVFYESGHTTCPIVLAHHRQGLVGSYLILTAFLNFEAISGRSICVWKNGWKINNWTKGVIRVHCIRALLNARSCWDVLP